MHRRFRDQKEKAVARPHRWLRWTAVILITGLVIYAAIDLFWYPQQDLRRFDSIAMGTLETEMWRSYYDRQPVQLYFQLAKMLRTQFGFPLLRSHLVAYHAADAAFVFKDGQQRSDYEKALPALQSYYRAIRNIGNIPFDVQKATQLELEWWIVHRQRDQHSRSALDTACANAAAEVYQVLPDSTLEHGTLRAEAMVIRDSGAASGGVSEDDWRRIESLLQTCYRSLQRVVSKQTTTAGLSTSL